MAQKPVVLTINGKAELVVQDAAAYQKLRQIAEEARVLEGIGNADPRSLTLSACRRKRSTFVWAFVPTVILLRRLTF